MPRPLRIVLLIVALTLPAACLCAAGVTVAFYNVENYSTVERQPESGLALAPKSPRAIGAVVGIIASVAPHILVLAEMDGPGAVADLRARLRGVGLDYPHSAWVEGPDADRRLALLSMFPILARDSLGDVPFELDGVRHRMARGILDVTLALPDGIPLRILGAHWKSRRETPAFDQAQFRAREALALRAHVSKILAANPEARLLVMGDLNDTRNEPPIRELMGARGAPDFLQEIAVADTRGERWTHYWKEADAYSRIDYLFASRTLAPQVALTQSGIAHDPDWNVASDHRLIFAVLTPTSP